MRAIITVVGQDTVGILASVSQVCAAHNANIIEVTQSVLQEMFVMVMLVNIDHLSGSINGLAQSMNEMGEEKNLKIHVMHEDIFHSMHRI
ncbi:MAG: ACT domain-containing protein [Oscillospiraceae bacterium]|nr:ACT domain-containing protein [Oscillospiraceae bacterium]